jgi:hypothetical protein
MPKFDLAANFDANRAVLSQGISFRIEAVAAVSSPRCWCS